MSNPQRHNAFVVYRGKQPGVYSSWADCQEQIDGDPKAKYLGYSSVYEAQSGWVEWEKKLARKLGASKFLQTATGRPKPEPSSAPLVWKRSVAPIAESQQARSEVRQVNKWRNEQPADILPSASRLKYTYGTAQAAPPPMPKRQPLNSPSPIAAYASSFEQPAAYNTPPVSSPHNFVPGFKRARSYIEIIDSDDEEFTPLPKKQHRMGEVDIPPVLTREERFELDKLDRQKIPAKAKVEEAKIILSLEQDKVVNLALRKNNIFLTGAAGCGKTVTLKEILARIKKRKKGGKVAVVAPTGIAALPLDGKTTYSFAGWNIDSFRTGIEELMKKRRPGVCKTIRELDVLIVEEISMVENHFLERLNRLFQAVMDDQRPFGGKQVILLGDFHQLPPVLPFQRCIQCGQNIPKKEFPTCTAHTCISREDAEGQPVKQTQITWADKWAFKSQVWKDLKLRHIKLEEIHRQKDTRFQDLLNNIRNGIPLSAEQWHDLERPKELPANGFAVRLMSRLDQVKSFNEQNLNSLTSSPRTWKAYDSAEKLITSSGGVLLPASPWQAEEYKKSLRDHRFPGDLTLKVGARVVLLHNLDQTRGLVNGSQGSVIGFSPDMEDINTMELHGGHKEFRKTALLRFAALHDESRMRPVVRFTNGVTILISAFASASLRGPPDPHEQYVATRTQIPLTLAWALSIHKSQGMTLSHVEVSSKDIFESGQLYVALSRATHLEGLRLTGFMRNQLPMDPDVLRFYTETKWEKLERKPRKVGVV